MNKQPQPLRTVYWAAFAAVIPLVVAVLNQPGSRDGAMRLLFMPFPVLVALLGVILALDVRRNTSRMVEVAREEGQPVFSARVGRLVGAGVAVAGVTLVVMFALGMV